MSELCERCGCEIATRACVYRGDKRVEHSPIQECIDALRQRLAAAEAQADHVSFEHEVDTQQLEAKLAAAEAAVHELEEQVTSLESERNELNRRLVAAEACANREYNERAAIEIGHQSLTERLAAAEMCCKSYLARIAELESYTHGTAQTMDDLESKLAAAEARSLDPTVAQQKLLDELAAARAEIVRLKTISVAQLVREAELSKNPGELEPRHLED